MKSWLVRLVHSELSVVTAQAAPPLPADPFSLSLFLVHLLVPTSFTATSPGSPSFPIHHHLPDLRVLSAFHVARDPLLPHPFGPEGLGRFYRRRWKDLRVAVERFTTPESPSERLPGILPLTSECDCLP